MFWAQSTEDFKRGEVLYTGEAEDLATRQKQHLRGPKAKGNKFAELSDFFRLTVNWSLVLHCLWFHHDFFHGCGLLTRNNLYLKMEDQNALAK